MDAVHTALLPVRQPYAFGASQRALAGFAPCAGDQVVTGNRIRRALPRPGAVDEAVVVDISAGPELTDEVALDAPPHLADRPACLRLRVFAARPLAASEADAVETAVTNWLSLDDDMREFLRIAADDPAMTPILAATQGLHQVRFPGLAEGAAYFTLTQRSTRWYASARKRRLAADLGPRLTVDGVTYVAFPDAGTLAGLDLAPWAGSEARGQRLAEVLAGVAALDEGRLRRAPYEEARDALLSIRGVGMFTAHALLLRVLGRPEEAPLEMEQFRITTRAVYGDPAPGPAVLRERYGPYLGWWAYLCRTGLSWLGGGVATSPVRAA